MSTTLLLNADFSALTVLNWKRAMLLVLDDRAEIVEADEENPIRSATAEWPRPLVVRLIAYVKIPFSARVALNKRNLYQRDGGVCQYCDKKVGMSSATIDHVKPRSRGGRNHWNNVLLSCSPCNDRKGNKLLSELGWETVKEPHVPKREGKHILLGYMANVPEQWEPYLLHPV